MVHEDEDAEFDEFFRATWARMFRTAYGVAGDRATAEDALQSAYAKAFASWGRVRAAGRPEAYVRRMVVNEVLDVRRKGWWRRERPLHDERPPDAASPEVSSTERDVVWRAVLSLPPRQRAVLVLRYYEDLSEADIAETLGVTRGTVKSQASAALAALRATHLSDQKGEHS